MRLELAALGLQAHALDEALLLGVEIGQRRRRLGAGMDGAGLGAPEGREPVEGHLDRLPRAPIAQGLHDVARQSPRRCRR
jgi:hypothetical protein